VTNVSLQVWTALEVEGLGCNLQHYNFLAPVIEDTKKMWDLPEHWKLNAQLVFGKPVVAPIEKKFDPLDHRYKVFA
jgi:predicted oxidoreductase (fatty acid repression mutant protein)